MAKLGKTKMQTSSSDDNVRGKPLKNKVIQPRHIIPTPERPEKSQTSAEQEAAKKFKKQIPKDPSVTYTISKEERMMDHIIGKMRLNQPLTAAEEQFVSKTIGTE